MKYVSTRGRVEPMAFEAAVLMGLADDGGLLIPQEIPDVTARLDAWRGLSYADLAFEVMRPYADDLPAGELKALIDRTYGEAFRPEVAPLARVGELFVLELWHGPTLAFKDVALQFLGNLFEHTLDRSGGRMNILGATSGDTGSAAICGARGRRGINIFVMHPRGRVSPIQERQMTTVLDDNVHNIAIEGSFDDCQRIMKTLAADLDFKRRYCLGAVNSVNWARLLAQIVYYFKAAFDVQDATGAPGVRVCVPTGNFGNVLAGWYARSMGAPISQLVLATNANDILARFFNTGVYALGNVRQTLSPSMDIQVASNFERYLYYRLGCDARRLNALMAEFSRTGSLQVAGEHGGGPPEFLAGAGSEADTLATIRQYHERHGYLLDPHTAVGVAVAERIAPSDQPVVCLATAHPAKFPRAIEQAVGGDVAHHPAIDALMDLETRCQVLPGDEEAVREFIVRTVG
jgi:threonine synthase